MNPNGSLSIPLPLSGMSVSFNPHNDNIVGIAMAENFGMVGGGLARIM